MKRIQNNRGSAIGTTMMVLATVGTITGITLSVTAAQGRMSRNSADYIRITAVADSAMERLFDDWRAQMNLIPLGGKLTQAQLDTITSGVPGSFSAVHPGFTDLTGEFLTQWPRPNGQSTDPSYKIQEVNVFGDSVNYDPADPSTYSISTGPMPGFDGLFAVNHTYYARVTVRGHSIGTQPVITVARTFTRSEAPVFQAAIYYEDDLELHPGENMTIAGPFLSNHRIYAVAPNGKTLTFASNVICNKEPDKVIPGSDYPARPKWLNVAQTIPNPEYNTQRFNETLPPIAVSANGYNPANYHTPEFVVGKNEQLNQKSDRLEPAGRDVRAAFNATDSNANNDGFRELIEKPVTAAALTAGDANSNGDPDAVEKLRFYNQANLRISVVATSGAPTVTATYKDGTAVSSTVLAKIQAAILGRPNVYDRREQANVRVTRVDVNKLRDAVDLMNASGSAATKFNGIVYFSDDTASGATGYNAKWAFRMENATKLPTYDAAPNEPSNKRGFTIATSGGIYLKGDYNTHTGAEPVPAAVLADAVMFLSKDWDDANAERAIEGNDTTGDGVPDTAGRQAVATAYKCAVMAGTIPSGYDPDGNGPIAAYGSGGGAHNFPRFLEKWNNAGTPIDMNFTGSMVQLFTSKMFTGKWSVGEVYHAPRRVWAYNSDFTRRPSPGLFAFTFYNRGPWRRE